VIRLSFLVLVFTQVLLSACSTAQSPVFIGEQGDRALHPDLNLPLRDELKLLAPQPLANGLIDSSSLEQVCDGPCGSDSGCTHCYPSIADQWTPWQGFGLFQRLDLQRFSVAERFRRQRTGDRGIGYERVMFAPNVLDTAIVNPHIGIRFQLDQGLNAPNRSEYFWNAGSGTNNGADPEVRTFDSMLRMAIGNDKAMAFIQQTLRSLDPTIEDDATGFGDLVIGAQALLMDGKRTKAATLLRTYIPTGSSSRGLGAGHASIEHGYLARYCLSAETYLFGEVKYWFPIGGTPGTSGDVLTTGWGISTIASESDIYALMPTFEIRTLSFLSGEQTVGGNTVELNGLTAVELYPGVRIAFGPASDVGLWEFGFAAGVTVADDDWFDTRLVFDLRLSK